MDLLALLLSFVLGGQEPYVDPYAHPCDQLQQRGKNIHAQEYAPDVGVPVTLWFCGPEDAELVPYAVDIDDVPQPSPGRLVMAHYEYSPRQRPNAGLNGMAPYVGPGDLIVMPSVGLHTIRVVYGASKKTVTFQWRGK